ncbi:DUF599 domain-containing protein [Zavarzinia compransoris]|uniref:DUF599 domain-containing protein n=1 Tax=Zavarzinia compransoris TaxID=1264899 RepID=A0A317DW68_9PROT|nr:DUF599 domain-containing protein [Zavarzinia compransoris]PWR18967.1 DUF599 domain-containing protein [Zavarzinia compransoris]TDP48968.1 putative membrane protein [Zavarzinia compransoris]
MLDSLLASLFAFGFTAPDLLALGLFGAVWFGYEPGLNLVGRRFRTINFTMKVVRRHWMENMAKREMRVADAALMGHVMNSAAFFASTTVLIAAALLGALAGLDGLQQTVESLDFTTRTTRGLFEVKVLLPLAVFVAGFFRFSWALRQFNYAIALIGATPGPQQAERAEMDTMADLTADVLSQGAQSFNGGIRAYYFALAALFWFGGPYAFTLATLAVVVTLLRRQISSRTAVAIRNEARKLTRY